MSPRRQWSLCEDNDVVKGLSVKPKLGLLIGHSVMVTTCSPLSQRGVTAGSRSLRSAYTRSERTLRDRRMGDEDKHSDVNRHLCNLLHIFCNT